MIPAIPSEFTQATCPLALIRTPMDNSKVKSSTALCLSGFAVRTAMPPPLKLSLLPILLPGGLAKLAFGGFGRAAVKES